MKQRFLVLMTTAIVALAASRANAGLVVNGSFETVDFSGWTLTGNLGFTGVGGDFDGVAPVDGNIQAYFGAVGSLGYLSQDIATTPGATYSLRFALMNFGGTPSEYTVIFGGTTLVDVVNAPAFEYTYFTLHGVAVGTTTTLSFGFRQDPSYFLLDDISASIASPEPMTAASLGAGLLFGIGALIRRRQEAC